MKHLFLAAALLAAAAGGDQADKKTGAAHSAPIATVSIAELDGMLSQKAATPVDANGDATRKKKGVIPGAVRLSDYETSCYELPADKPGRAAFYCANEQCGASHTAAEKAIVAGYRDVRVLLPASWLVGAGSRSTAFAAPEPPLFEPGELTARRPRPASGSTIAAPPPRSVLRAGPAPSCAPASSAAPSAAPACLRRRSRHRACCHPSIAGAAAHAGRPGAGDAAAWLRRALETAAAFGLRRVDVVNAWRVDKAYLPAPASPRPASTTTSVSAPSKASPPTCRRWPSTTAHAVPRRSFAAGAPADDLRLAPTPATPCPSNPRGAPHRRR
jgi:hypothetical protein